MTVPIWTERKYATDREIRDYEEVLEKGLDGAEPVFDSSVVQALISRIKEPRKSYTRKTRREIEEDAADYIVEGALEHLELSLESAEAGDPDEWNRAQACAFRHAISIVYTFGQLYQTRNEAKDGSLQ